MSGGEFCAFEMIIGAKFGRELRLEVWPSGIVADGGGGIEPDDRWGW